MVSNSKIDIQVLEGRKHCGKGRKSWFWRVENIVEKGESPGFGG